MIPQVFEGEPVILIIARWLKDGEDVQGILTDLCCVHVGSVRDYYLECYVDTSRVKIHRNDSEKVVIEHLPTSTKIVSFKTEDPTSSYSMVI